MRYEILDSEGIVVNTILADEEFVAREYPGRYPGRYRLAAFQEKTEIKEITNPICEKIDKIIAKLEEMEKIQKDKI